jgi:hypothetical protein
MLDKMHSLAIRMGTGEKGGRPRSQLASDVAKDVTTKPQARRCSQ